MNKGVIYKITVFEENKENNNESVTKKYYINLDDYKKISDKVYNLYINDEVAKNDLTTKDIIEQAVTLFPIEKDFTSAIDLTAYLGKKLYFVFDIAESKITAIEEGFPNAADAILEITK